MSQRRGGGDPADQGRVRRPVTVGELVRAQMRVSEKTDSRVRRALLRVAAGQVCAFIRTFCCCARMCVLQKICIILWFT